MNDAKKKEVENFFQELQKWNRVVVQQPATEVCQARENEHSDDQVPEKKIFFRVDCDTVALGARKDAKLA